MNTQKPGSKLSTEPAQRNQKSIILEFIRYFSIKSNGNNITIPLLFSLFQGFLHQFSIPKSFRGTRKCCFCKIKENLLIKCQHPGCFVYCHPTCYLEQSDYRLFHLLSNDSSVSLLFFCSKHEQDVSRLNQKHSRKCLCKSLFPLLSEFPQTGEQSVSSESSTPTTADALQSRPDQVSSYQLYSHLDYIVQVEAELYPYQHDSLHFTKRKIERILSKQNVIVSGRKMKLLCAICGAPLKAEIFPRLKSRLLTCERCGVQVHAFCEYTKDSHWKCVHCENPKAVCKFCGQGRRFLSRLPFGDSYVICHFGCALMNEDNSPGDDSLLCKVCRKGRYVLKCNHDGCSKASHVYCTSGLFFVTPSHHFLYLCHEHILDVFSYFNESFSETESPLLKPFFNLRHCFSLGTIHVYNNTKYYNRLYDIFTSMGLLNPKTKRIEEKKETEEGHRRIESKLPEVRVKKKESFVCFFELTDRKPQCQEICNVCDTRFLWRYVKNIFCEVKKKDIGCLFRMNPKTVGFIASIILSCLATQIHDA